MENINKEEILALIDKLHALGAAVEVDLEGQIVVYTGIKIIWTSTRETKLLETK